MSFAAEWLADFERAHGRPLRVLHIGNIANNAYNNAKIQRARGIAADVLCHDYYHIMACPEWEDADFAGNISDEMFPDWWATRLKGFSRPRWFAQGPLDASIRYLLAHSISASSSKWLWRALETERWFLCRKSWKTRLVKSAVRVLARRQIAYVSLPMNTLLFHLISASWRLLAFVQPISQSRMRLKHRADRFKRFARVANLASDAQRHRDVMRRKLPGLMERAASVPTSDSVVQPLRTDELEWGFLWWWHPYISLLFRRYDIVQAYATYTAMPFIAGMEDYFAYEHGTIRSIPFQDTGEGRLCAATYRLSESVFVTNSDNLSAAARLNLRKDKIVCLPHAFDSDKLERFARQRDSTHRTTTGPVVFFSPTRQHWIDNDPGWAKGNDRVLHALARVLKTGLNCKLRLVAWGKDLEATKSLSKSLALEPVIEWLPTMKKRELWLEYLSADAVLDQFVVPAMGGVTFEAMMLGRRVVSAIDEGETAHFFGEPPPIHNCQSIDSIAAAMTEICRDRSDLAKRGEANQSWMKRYHSADRIVELQVAAYRRLLGAREHTVGVGRSPDDLCAGHVLR